MLRPSSSLHLLPRQPDNVGSVLRYIVGSDKKGGASMLESFSGLTFLSGRKRDNIVRRKGKRYQLGLAGERELCINEGDCIQRAWR